MTHKSLYLLLSVMVTSLALAGCHSDGHSQTTSDSSQVVVEDSVDITPEVSPEPEPEPVVDTTPVVKEVTAPKPVAKKKSTPKPKSETIYVSTYDRGGQVWGHITMTGDKGRGTIHDAEENHYTVTCTRHGNELFAVDQNSRQYVFKIK